MLRHLPAPPSDLGKSGEAKKHSPALDRATGDKGDLRVFGSADGSKSYLRVWEGTAERGAAQWYECVAPAPEAETK